MELLLRIQRRLMWRPLREVIVDDFRRWKAFEVQALSWHIARQVERASQARAVGVMLPTSGLFPAAMMAIWQLGRVAVPLNYLLSRPDMEHVCKDAGIDCCITVGPMLEFTGGLPDGVKPLRLDAQKFSGLPPVRRAVRRSPDDLAVLLYTSGTSGKPKGVMLSCGNLAANVRQITEYAQFDSRDAMLGVLPQFHSFGLTVLTLLPLAVGCTAHYTAKFVPRKIIDIARERKPTVLVAIPSMYNALRLVKDAHPADMQSFRYIVSGGEPLPQAVFDGFLEKFGCRITEGYGLTETAPVTNWCLPGEWRWRSVGRALPGVQEEIVAPDGRTLPPGEEGEIRIKGPNVMQGYWNLQNETSAVFDERGFFRTGDIGKFDADGHLFITGRLKEMLIIGGENVFPREIEEVLDRHESVKASAVIGAPDASRGEVALAFVELKDGAAFDETALRSWCRHHLAQFKVPREIRCMDALPRNPTGKIMRRALKA
jgi:long-chain acyl-CoA synthetase